MADFIEVPDELYKEVWNQYSETHSHDMVWKTYFEQWAHSYGGIVLNCWAGTVYFAQDRDLVMFRLKYS